MVKCHLQIGEEEKQVLANISFHQVKDRIRNHEISNVLFLVLYSIACSRMFQQETFKIDLVTGGLLVLGLLIIIIRRNRPAIVKSMQRSEIDRNIELYKEREYAFQEEDVRCYSENQDSMFRWKAFVKYGDISHYIYLLLHGNKVVLVDKHAQTEEELTELYHLLKNISVREDLSMQEEDEEKTLGRTILDVITGLLLLVSAGCVSIKACYPRTDGEFFREWYSVRLQLWLLFIWGVICFIWVCVSVRSLVKSTARRKVFRIICLCLLEVLCIGTLLLYAIIIDFQGGKETEKPNGKLLVTYDDGYGVRYELCEKENFLIRRYIGRADADGTLIPIPSKSETPEEAQEKTPEHTQTPQMTEQEKKELERYKLIEEGNRAIFDLLNENGLEYRENYDAKGNSMVKVYEDVSAVRFIKFDKNIENETIGQYVYFQSEKSSDGSWNWTEAEIIDIYQYVYQTKEIIDTGKTSW